MHGRPLSLVLGAACGFTAGSVACVIADKPLVQLAAGVLALVALLRAAMGLVAHSPGRTGWLARRCSTASALAYAFAIGLAAALSLLLGARDDLQIMLVGFAIAYGTGIALGNGGRPLLGMSQSALALLPVSLAAAMLATLPMLTLAAILPVLMTGLAMVTQQVFIALSSRVNSARESEKLARQMHGQARRDEVTGLANRTGLEEAATALALSRPEGTRLVLMWLDLYRFKEVNDTLGHKVGDKVLREVARRLSEVAPEEACLARFGIDEFVIAAALPGRRDVEQLAARISGALAEAMHIAGHRVHSGCSIGIAVAEEAKPDIDALMQQADLALYQAKASGRQQTCFFDQSMTRNLARRKEIEAELRGAILRDELSIYFQPIIDLETGRIRAFEALVRWFHPDKGELIPQEFIPVAEDTGLIITLGNWITRQAARTCATWPAHVTLAVNLSPVQIRAPGAALGILEALKEARLDPARLELEVTESLFLEDHAETASFMNELAAHGVRFALDDFGTGYSSLHYINRYPFRTIKVDRSFVSGPHAGTSSDAIIRAVAEMGATLGMEIVAEGLETPEQVRAVRRAGCTLGQGYHFCRAVPDHLAARLLDEEAGEDRGLLAAG